MNVHELKVGNRILSYELMEDDDGKFMNWCPVKIESIEKRGEVFFINNRHEENFSEKHLCELDIRNFGFRSETPDIWIYPNTKFRIIRHHDQYYSIMAAEELILDRIYFVHQLQNLFHSLTNVELK